MTQAKETTAEGHRRLAEALAALGNPVRISLLERIRSPKPLKDIRVESPSPPGSRGSTHLISRQAVKQHLERLEEIGVVLGQEVEREYGETMAYVVNHQALYALAERLRDLARLRPIPELGLATIHAGTAELPPKTPGPGLLLVKGLEEGRIFPLATPSSGPRRWIVGRRRGLAVALDFDPFVSSENAAIHEGQGRFEIEDLPHSRNGTSLNFLPLEKGRRYPLTSGDVVGVGRCFLVFRA